MQLLGVFKFAFGCVFAVYLGSVSGQTWQSFVPDHFAILDTVFGDLNLDPYPDVLLLLRHEHEAESPDMDRPVILLTGNAQGTYTQIGRNDHIVLCKGCGGVFGDPYGDAWIEHGTFSLHHYGGSAWRWTQEITFSYRQDTRDFILLQDVGESFHTSAPNKVKKLKNQKENWNKISFESYTHK